MKIIDKALLDEVSAKAMNSERLRMNYNLHESLDADVQKLLNAMEPGTIVPVHRHRDTAETYFLLRGRMVVRFYNDNGEVVSKEELSPVDGKYGVDIPVGQWHGIEVLETGTVIFEVKQGPYTPINPEDTMQL